MIDTAAALALSRKSPKGAVILEQTCLGSSQRALRSSTNMAVLLLSRVKGFGSGRFGPSCAQALAAESVTQSKNRADRIAMLVLSFHCTAISSVEWIVRVSLDLPVVLCSTGILIKEFIG